MAGKQASDAKDTDQRVTPMPPVLQPHYVGRKRGNASKVEAWKRSVAPAAHNDGVGVSHVIQARKA